MVIDAVWDQEAYVPIYIEFFILTQTTTEVTLNISVRVQYVYTNNIHIRFVISYKKSKNIILILDINNPIQFCAN